MISANYSKPIKKKNVDFGAMENELLKCFLSSWLCVFATLIHADLKKDLNHHQQ